MARKLTDAELVTRTRESNRRRGERHRKRLTQAGKEALTIWIPTAIRQRLIQTATHRGATIAETATDLLARALDTCPDEAEPAPAITQAERDQQILEWHRQGLSNYAVAEKMECSEATIRRTLKRVKTLEAV